MMVRYRQSTGFLKKEGSHRQVTKAEKYNRDYLSALRVISKADMCTTNHGSRERGLAPQGDWGSLSV